MGLYCLEIIINPAVPVLVKDEATRLHGMLKKKKNINTKYVQTIYLNVRKSCAFHIYKFLKSLMSSEILFGNFNII